MAGCTNCKSKSGCDDRKGDMFGAIDEALAALYPTRTWGEIDDDARQDGLGDGAGAALAEELAGELDAATFLVPGDSCDFIYVLCIGRTPCLLQMRDLGVPPPVELGLGAPIREQYLRICLSGLARMAGVQQVALDADPVPGGWLIRERPRAGVYDAPLLRRMQRLVAVLPAYELLHLDFGEISAAPPGFAPGGWTELYGAGTGEPAVANYIFYPQPTTMVTTTFLPAVGVDLACSTTR